MRRILVVLVLLAACKPDLGAPPSLVDDTRFLAITSDPPEAAPGATVTLHALIATPDGTVSDDAPATWAICTTPKPVSVNNIVSDQCVFEAQDTLPAHKLTVSATIPMDACSLFGPDPPQAAPGQPPLRPTDPDATGGYFQPVRALFQLGPDHYIGGFALPRITCNLPDAPSDVAVAFRDTYTPNQNPVIARVLVSIDGATSVDLPADVPAGHEVTFVVLWPAQSAETYPVFDRASRTLVDHREALRVSWFATDGVFEHDATGAGEDDPATETQNLWTAPTTPGVVHGWVVLRDSRGGADVRAFDVNVTP
jgi:hypothetical protein